MLECTGRLQKCRLYAMSDNKAFRATVSCLIVRDVAHEKEKMPRHWNLWELTGIRHFRFRRPTVQKCLKFGEIEKRNLHNQQWTFTNDKSGLGEIFNGESPFGDGEVETLDGLPEGFDIPQMPEAPQEYSPGLDKELKQKAGV